MQRLGKNIGKYFGEAIDIQRVLAEMEIAAEAHGWNSEVFLKTDSYKLISLAKWRTRRRKFTFRPAFTVMNPPVRWPRYNCSRKTDGLAMRTSGSARA
jgi:hypothetical protein